MAAPVAAARLLNGVQDTPIDSDDAPFYRAKTGFVDVVGFAGNLTAQIAFQQRATRGELDPFGLTPQGLFVGAFVKQANRGELDLTGFAGTLGGVSWRSIPSPLVSIDRTLPFPQYIPGVKANYLVDPLNVVTSVQAIAYDAVPAGVAQYDANNVFTGYGPVASPLGVMFGRTGILADDLIWVLQQPANALAAVTLRAGGAFGAPTAPTGRHFFAWEWLHSGTGIVEQFSWFFVVP